MGFDAIAGPAIKKVGVADRGFKFGIEEEFFLVDRETGRVASETPSSLFSSANLATEGVVGREFLQSQVEVTTQPLSSISQARAELSYMRGVLARFASFHGLELAAVGTHPLSRWRDVRQSENARYDEVMADLQIVGRRNMFCGMHIHVEIPDPTRRVELMGRLNPYLPLFLALSSSSPFWEGRPSGLKAYRMAAYSELPRSGIPEHFNSNQEYESYVQCLITSGAIKDASYIWWMLRPSDKYPTLELRAPDSCTRVGDAIGLAALYRALVRHLYYAPPKAENSALARALTVDNKWQAQRHGTAAVFATPDGPKSVRDALGEVIEMVSFDAELLGCRDEVKHCRDIAESGSSADMQLKVYDENPSDGLLAVAKWLSETTTA